MPRSCRYQRGRALKVRSAVKAGGVDVNHSRSLLRAPEWGTARSSLTARDGESRVRETRARRPLTLKAADRLLASARAWLRRVRREVAGG